MSIIGLLAGILIAIWVLAGVVNVLVGIGQIIYGICLLAVAGLIWIVATLRDAWLWIIGYFSNRK